MRCLLQLGLSDFPIEDAPETSASTETPPAAPTSTAERPGDRIGRFRLVRPIGEGGFGVVFEAEQEEPVRRTVALKVIKLGMDTKQVVARFEAERQALAMMDHPNIAKVLDGGTTPAGRPYFVMELVRGQPITQYCDAERLSLDARLELFVQVCAAVQHAHQKGIIHRDLKPSNILVQAGDPGQPGVPKVIDFGIAKATLGARLTERHALHGSSAIRRHSGLHEPRASRHGRRWTLIPAPTSTRLGCCSTNSWPPSPPLIPRTQARRHG